MNNFKTIEEIQSIMKRNRSPQQEQAVISEPVPQPIHKEPVPNEQARDIVGAAVHKGKYNHKEYQKVYQKKYYTADKERKKDYNRIYYQKKKEVEPTKEGENRDLL